ncbi:MAG: carboxy-S-adenosyl-L-methionine synthase [Nitrospinaceae bacterium]|nr:MAG: carboxy-S-adenosyl-L-methionine synthase [Nitrospinaceae bacterium]
MTIQEKDKLFRQTGSTEKFEFNEPVARVFDDMLERSVPMYRECLQSAVDWCARFARQGTHVYDLGCSTGTLLTCLADRLPADSGIRLIGLDNSNPMLLKAEEKLKPSPLPWKLVEADLEGDFSLTDASVVIMNYTLQFIPPDGRLNLTRKIFQELNDGGLLILIEKVISDNSKFDKTFIEFHHAYKRAQGYSQLEIARKREALENVLTPWTVGENINLLMTAGFASTELFFKWNNFAGFVALK